METILDDHQSQTQPERPWFMLGWLTLSVVLHAWIGNYSMRWIKDANIISLSFAAAPLLWACLQWLGRAWWVVFGYMGVWLFCSYVEENPREFLAFYINPPGLGSLILLLFTMRLRQHHAPNPSLWVGTRLLIQTYLASWLLIAMLSSNHPMPEHWAIGLRFIPLSMALVVVWRRTRLTRQQLTSEERWGWQILWWALYSIGISTNAYWTRYTIVWSGYSLAWAGEVDVWAAWLDPLLYIGNVFHWMGHLLLLLALVLATRQAFKKWYTTQ